MKDTLIIGASLLGAAIVLWFVRGIFMASAGVLASLPLG